MDFRYISSNFSYSYFLLALAKKSSYLADVIVLYTLTILKRTIMKKLTVLLALMTTLLVTTFAQNENLVTSKSFNIEAGKKLVVTLGMNVEVVEWEQEHMSVVTTITPENYGGDKLTWFVTKGLFNTVAKPEADKIVVFYPLADKTFKINGKTTKQELKYTVHVPKGTVVELIKEEKVKNDF